jgi:hypothetical protein
MPQITLKCGKLQKSMAVGAVWLKLVSGCISLLTGKLTANVPFSGSFSGRLYAVNAAIYCIFGAVGRLYNWKRNRELILPIRDLEFPDPSPKQISYFFVALSRKRT